MQIEQPNVIVVPVSSVDVSTNLKENNEIYENKSEPYDIKTSKWSKVRAAHRRILPRASRGEIKLSNLIDDLQKFAIEEQEIPENDQITVSNYCNCIKLFRRYLINFLQKPSFHYIVISLVITDLIIVLIDLVLAQLSSPCLTEEEMEQYNTTIQRETCLVEHSIHLYRADLFLFYLSVTLLSIFVLEIFLSFYAFGWKYYKNLLYLLDGSIVFASFIMEIYFHYGNIGRAGRAASAIVILRLWKIIRAIHAVAHSITLKNRLLIKKIQEAKVLLEEEKLQTEQILEKQEIKLDYFINILTTIGKLPSTNQIDKYVDNIWKQRKKQSELNE